MGDTKDLTLSLLEEEILTVLMREGERGSYGLGIIELTSPVRERYNKPKLSVGGIYQAFDRLEARGFIQSIPEDNQTTRRGGAHRVCYRITSEGTAALVSTWSFRREIQGTLSGIIASMQ